MRYTFKTYERLKHEQHIDTLFRKGKAYSVFPLRLIFLHVARGSEPAPARAGFSVPKKKFKRAVQRQRIKRLMREAWRLHKHILYGTMPADRQLHLFWIYNDLAMPEYTAISQAMEKAIAHLAETCSPRP